MTKHNIATQIWPFRKAYGEDLPETLKKIKSIGFKGVELCRWFDWTDLFDKWSTEEIKAACEDTDLEAVSVHIPYYMIDKARLEELVSFCEIQGMKYAIVASLPKTCFKSKRDLLAVAEKFNQAAELLSSSGLRIGYHCHQEDFKTVDGEIPWEILFDNTTTDVVMQMDTGNAMSGGADPVHYLKKYPGRAALIHLKEYQDHGPVEAIGDGKVDWDRVLEISKKLHQPSWYIIEQEEKQFDPWDSARKSLSFLRAMGW